MEVFCYLSLVNSQSGFFPIANTRNAHLPGGLPAYRRSKRSGLSSAVISTFIVAEMWVFVAKERFSVLSEVKKHSRRRALLIRRMDSYRNSIFIFVSTHSSKGTEERRALLDFTVDLIANGVQIHRWVSSLLGCVWRAKEETSPSPWFREHATRHLGRGHQASHPARTRNTTHGLYSQKR